MVPSPPHAGLPVPGYFKLLIDEQFDLIPAPTVPRRREVLTLRSVKRMSIEAALIADIPARLFMSADAAVSAFWAPCEPFRLSLLRDRRRTAATRAEIILSDPNAAAVTAIDLSRLHVAPFHTSAFNSSHNQSQPFLS